jgi:hypothetical protein
MSYYIFQHSSFITSMKRKPSLFIMLSRITNTFLVMSMMFDNGECSSYLATKSCSRQHCWSFRRYCIFSSWSHTNNQRHLNSRLIHYIVMSRYARSNLVPHQLRNMRFHDQRFTSLFSSFAYFTTANDLAQEDDTRRSIRSKIKQVR